MRACEENREYGSGVKTSAKLGAMRRRNRCLLEVPQSGVMVSG